MASPAESLKDLILDAAIGFSAPTSSQYGVMVGKLGNQPDRLIAFYDSPGANPNPRWLLDFPNVQVLVRAQANGYGDGWNKAKQVKDALLGIDPVVKNLDAIDSITMLGDMAFVHYDDSQRPVFSVNFRLILRPPTNALTKREVL